MAYYIVYYYSRKKHWQKKETALCHVWLHTPNQETQGGGGTGVSGVQGHPPLHSYFEASPCYMRSGLKQTNEKLCSKY
jgi:hypothetical protein